MALDGKLRSSNQNSRDTTAEYGVAATGFIKLKVELRNNLEPKRNEQFTRILQVKELE